MRTFSRNHAAFAPNFPLGSAAAANSFLYGEMHRLIPIHAAWVGARVVEIPVKHHPRTRGISKYGLSRTFKVLLDLITVKLMGSFSTKPMYLFGGAGLLSCLAGVFFAGWTLLDKFIGGVKANRNPLLLLAVFLFLLGIQFILMGLVAELPGQGLLRITGQDTIHRSPDLELRQPGKGRQERSQRMSREG